MNSNIKFVDLSTGNVFDGHYPYTFWFNGEQGVNLFYTKPICFISREQTLNVSIQDNEIFKLLDTSKILNTSTELINDIDYYNLEKLISKTNELTLTGTPYLTFYVYIFYIIGSAQLPGEYIENIDINGEKFTIGADFYAEEESLYINLSNNGIEIPRDIQRAIYCTNVHEDKYDNITLNRKWKELLSNYWDICANKGSYKSLINSLKWFEYGDLIKLGEVWKHIDRGEERYSQKDIQSILSDKYLNSLEGFAKTTYLSLTCALEKICKDSNGEIIYDDEKNPILENISSIWSIQDLSLKLSLLGNFFETYFMPIHLDLIHSTIEDVIYTNTFKTLTGSSLDRSDFLCLSRYVKNNIKEDSVYQLTPVKCYVGPNTLFGNKKFNTTEKKEEIIGVQNEIPELNSDEDKRIFLSQLYHDIGSIVHFELDLPLDMGEYIKRETIYIKKPNNDLISYTDYKILSNKISFNILCKDEGKYDVKLQFDSTNSKTYISKASFGILDTDHITMKVYKIKPKPENKLQNPWKMDINFNDYIFAKYPINKNSTIYRQYIPATSSNNLDWQGARLNHLIILKGIIEDDFLTNNYFLLNRNNKYTICISKKFGYTPPKEKFILDNSNIYYTNQIDKYSIIRLDYIYIPQFHELKPIGGNKLQDYILSQTDTLCVIPDLSRGKSIDLIQNPEWEFINSSDNTSIKLNKSINEPFISNKEPKLLTPGYYDIIFKYRLANNINDINTVALNSAFIIK